MNNEEKIRLVLETLGTDNVKQANRVLREMQEELVKVGNASTQAAGKSGPNGMGVLQLAYFIDDLQYGMRGIINNMPQLVQAMGLGAGMAGVVGIAAVAVSQLVDKFPGWIEGNEKIKLTVDQLVDAIKAEEAAVKRQKEEVEKLGKVNSDRIEDLTKLKIATEDLKAAEDQLAEDRKNRKAFEEAEKNVGAADKEELARRKGAFKDLVTDAGGEKGLRDQISNAVAGAMPDFQITEEHRKQARAEVIDEAGVDFMNMTAAEVDMHTERKLRSHKFQQKIRGRFRMERDAEIRKSTEAIFGGLAAPGTVAESDAAMAQLGQFAPDQAAAIRGLMDFDQQNAAFDTGNNRWRQGGGARRRAAERAAAQAEAAAGRMLPNGAMFDEQQRKQIFEQQKLSEAEMARQAAIRNEVLGQMDPMQMAALRNAQAGVGGFRGRNLQQLRGRDMNLFANALMERGMGRGEAEQAARESLSGGEEAFEQFASSVGKNLENGIRAQEASQKFFEMMNVRQQELEMRLEMLMMQFNMLGGQGQTTARPPSRVRN